MKASMECIRAGCNANAGAVSWGAAAGFDFVAYAAQNTVLIVDPQTQQVTTALLGHNSRVTCVHWLPYERDSGSLMLVSGDVDGDILLWAVKPHSHTLLDQLSTHSQKYHTSTINQICSVASSIEHSSTLLCSVAADSQCMLWEVSKASSDKSGSESLTLQQSLAIPCIQMSAELTFLPGKPAWLLLFLGGVDSNVRVFLKPPGGTFTQQCTLQGHSNWIRGLAAAHIIEDSGKLSVLVASGSQDRTARLWKVAEAASENETQGKDTEIAMSAKDKAVSFLMSYAPQHTLKAADSSLVASIHGVLLGHEDWVHSVAWIPRYDPSTADINRNGARSTAVNQRTACQQQSLQLLTASMDRTIMIWGPDKASGLWMCEESVGDAGPDSLGYYSTAASADASCIITNSYMGALHAWCREATPSVSPTLSPSLPPLLPQPFVTGHWRDISAHMWAIDGQCILTASADQTVRLHACTHGGSSRSFGGEACDGDSSQREWFEFARPQIHGHDFHSLAEIKRPSLGARIRRSQKGRAAASSATGEGDGPVLGSAWQYMYASASEEKVVRAFLAPEVFVKSLAKLRRVKWEEIVAAAAEGGENSSGGAAGLLGFGLSASLPALGLSNKTVKDEGELQQGGSAEGGGCGGGYDEGPDFAPVARATVLQGRPLEEDLCAATLWPETHKLYGHGNDVYALAACPLGTCLVSACKAQTAEAAELRVWDSRVPAADLPCVQQLPVHTLTVTQLKFSPDGCFLLSVSRDRSFAVHARNTNPAACTESGAEPQLGDEGTPLFTALGSRAKAHDRIIWSAAWAPDGSMFATGARDKVLKLWLFDSTSPAVPSKPAAVVPGLQAAVTAVAFAPHKSASGGDVLAAAFENGDVELFSVTVEGQTAAVNRVWSADACSRHAAAVKCLEFNEMPDGSIKLASSGADHALRIFNIEL